MFLATPLSPATESGTEFCSEETSFSTFFHSMAEPMDSGDAGKHGWVCVTCFYDIVV